jgi:hypothetical protein
MKSVAAALAVIAGAVAALYFFLPALLRAIDPRNRSRSSMPPASS